MSEHIRTILGAYLDGELHGRKLEMVEEHLETCEKCREALASQQQLSFLLQEAPLAEDLMPVDRFVSQVALQLPARQEPVPAMKKLFEISWWLLPAGIGAGWVFLQTTFIVSSLFLLALQAGLQIAGVDVAAMGALQINWLARLFSTLELIIGGMGHEMLQFLAAGEALGWSFLLNFVSMVLFAILIWSWLATWWVRQQRGRVGSR